MSDSRPEKESKTWLIWLALGVALALVGPTWLFKWQFDPSRETIPEPAPAEASPTPSERDGSVDP